MRAQYDASALTAGCVGDRHAVSPSGPDQKGKVAVRDKRFLETAAVAPTVALKGDWLEQVGWIVVLSVCRSAEGVADIESGARRVEMRPSLSATPPPAGESSLLYPSTPVLCDARF
eukprot:3593117-Rhodomonas_salina.2